MSIPFAGEVAGVIDVIGRLFGPASSKQWQLNLSKKSPSVASAMTDVASHPTTSMVRGSVIRGA